MTKTVQVSEELYTKILAHCNASGVTVDEFVQQHLAQAVDQAQVPVYQKQDEAEIKERLQSLGYID